MRCNSYIAICVRVFMFMWHTCARVYVCVSMCACLWGVSACVCIYVCVCQWVCVRVCEIEDVLEESKV